jgi:hypothetical protein
MNRFLKKPIVLSFLMAAALSFGTSREERKEALAEPSRGLTKSTPKPAATPDSYSQMGESFSKALQESTKKFQESLPRVTDESSDSFLKKIQSTQSELRPVNLNQMTESIINSIRQLAALQIAYEENKVKMELAKAKAPRSDATSPPTFKTSQIMSAGFSGSIKNRIRRVKNGLGLFPSSVESLSNRAYNSPE